MSDAASMIALHPASDRSLHNPKPIHKLMRLLAVAALGTALSGCSTIRNWFGGEDNTEPPAELTDFDATLKVVERWSESVGDGVEEQHLNIGPVVVDGRVYAASRDGTVAALDASSGDTVWESDTDAPISGGPGTGDSLVLVGTSDGEVLALEMNDGVQRWRSRLSSEILAAPKADGGVTVARTVDGKLYGLASADGSRLWVRDHKVPVLSLRGNSAPTLVEGAAIAGLDDGRLVAVALDNGVSLWESRVGMPRGRTELERMVDIDGNLTVHERFIYVTTYQNEVAAVELASGRERWRRKVSSHSGAAVDGQHVYVTGDGGAVWALDRDTGASVWRQTALANRAVTAPAVHASRVVVADFQGYVHWLDPQDGHFLARERVSSAGVLAAPLAVGNQLYVYDRAGTLTAFAIE
ncbi:MAG: outer membrane protein assembly factor BamB [Gammaproteobacteria bacterium]